MPVQALMNALRAWVALQPDMRAAAVVGSYARGAATADSDVDVMLLTDHGAAYLAHPTWADAFGTVRTWHVEDWGLVTTLRVFYAAGLEVEYNFAPVVWAAVPVDAGTHWVVADGMHILYDPHELLHQLQQAVAESKTAADD